MKTITCIKPLRAPPSILRDVCEGIHPIFSDHYIRRIDMSQPHITEPLILDLNHIEWEFNGRTYEFIDLRVDQIEGVVSHLISGGNPNFDPTELLEQLRSHTHIIKNGAAYSYILLHGETGPFIILRQIPTEWDEEGNII